MSRPTHRRPRNRVRITRQQVSAAFAVGSISLLIAGFVATTAGPADAADAKVGLGTASTFAILAGSTVTNTGPSVISGNVGLSPGSSITGFPPGVVINGTQHISDGVADTAKDNLVTAYNDAAGRPTATDVTGQDLAGMTLTPGVYEASTAMALTGTLTLNAQGNDAAVFIFKAGSTLVTGTNSKVQFVNGGSPCNVFWLVGSSATLGTSTQFVGTILALTSATLNTSATVEGRVLARNGAVTLDSNVITAPGCSTVTPTSNPSATVTSTATSVPVGSPSSTGTGGPSPSGTSTTTSGDTTPTTSDSPSDWRPKPTPTNPTIPKKHPDTGLGGALSSPSGVLFLLAGLGGGSAVVASALGFRRTNKPRE